MRRNKFAIFVHFVWTTHDRHPIIVPAIERDLHRYIASVCRDDRCEVLAVGGTPDHVHLLVSLSNTITVAQLMRDVKGGSSHFVSERLRPGEWFQWQANYGALSVSPNARKQVMEYIHNQKAHHADGTLWPEAEEAFIEDDRHE
jgi:putative transposase